MGISALLKPTIWAKQSFIKEAATTIKLISGKCSEGKCKMTSRSRGWGRLCLQDRHHLHKHWQMLTQKGLSTPAAREQLRSETDSRLTVVRVAWSLETQSDNSQQHEVTR